MLRFSFSLSTSTIFALTVQSVCRADATLASTATINTLGEVDRNQDISVGDQTNSVVIESEEVSKNNKSAASIENPPPLECGIWLAPSALTGAGLGMYAGKNFKKGDMLQHVGDMCIPIVDISVNTRGTDFEFLWDQYTWNSNALGMDQEGTHEVNVASPGFGSAANSFLPIVNVEEGEPRRDFAGLHRSKDPGAGAFTPYYDRGSSAERDIEAGEEFYVSYGSQWFTGMVD